MAFTSALSEVTLVSDRISKVSIPKGLAFRVFDRDIRSIRYATSSRLLGDHAWFDDVAPYGQQMDYLDGSREPLTLANPDSLRSDDNTSKTSLGAVTTSTVSSMGIKSILDRAAHGG